MREHERLAAVLAVACLTEDRDGTEQRAMLDVALRLDTERAAFKAYRDAPGDPAPPCFVEMVEQSYNPVEGRRVGLAADQRRRLARLHAKFEPCPDCGVIRGDHALSCLTIDVEAHRARRGPHEGALL